MAAIQSNGAGGGNWNVGASWNGGVAPGVGDTAQILNADTITLQQNESVDSWTLDNGGSLVLNGYKVTTTAQCTQNDDIDFSSSDNSELDLQGGLQIINSVSDMINANAASKIRLAGDFDGNAVDWVQTNDKLSFYFDASINFENRATGAGDIHEAHLPAAYTLTGIGSAVSYLTRQFSTGDNELLGTIDCTTRDIVHGGNGGGSTDFGSGFEIISALSHIIFYEDPHTFTATALVQMLNFTSAWRMRNNVTPIYACPCLNISKAALNWENKSNGGRSVKFYDMVSGSGGDGHWKNFSWTQETNTVSSTNTCDLSNLDSGRNMYWHGSWDLTRSGNTATLAWVKGTNVTHIFSGDYDTPSTAATIELANSVDIDNCTFVAGTNYTLNTDFNMDNLAVNGTLTTTKAHDCDDLSGSGTINNNGDLDILGSCNMTGTLQGTGVTTFTESSNRVGTIGGSGTLDSSDGTTKYLNVTTNNFTGTLDNVVIVLDANIEPDGGQNVTAIDNVFEISL
jgi:hypothetical protein